MGTFHIRKRDESETVPVRSSGVFDIRPAGTVSNAARNWRPSLETERADELDKQNVPSTSRAARAVGATVLPSGETLRTEPAQTYQPVSRLIEESNAAIRYNRARERVEQNNRSANGIYSNDFAQRSAAQRQREQDESALREAVGALDRLGIREEIAPTLLQRAKNVLTGAGKTYAGSMAGGMSNTITGEARRQEQERAGELRAWQDTVDAYTEVLRDPTASRSERETAQAVISDLTRRMDAYRTAYGTGGVNDRAAAETARMTDALTQSGAADIERAKNGLGTLGRLAVNTGVAGLQMGADAALGTVTGAGAMLPMMARSFGGGVQEARSKGYSHEQQMALGLANAATEYFSEKLFGGNPVYDRRGRVIGTDDMQLVNRAIHAAVTQYAGEDAARRVMGVLGSGAAEILNEGWEEVVSDLLNPMWEQLLTGNRSEIRLQELAEDWVIGAALGGMGHLMEAAGGGRGSGEALLYQPQPGNGTQTPATLAGAGQGAVQTLLEGNLMGEPLRGTEAQNSSHTDDSQNGRNQLTEPLTDRLTHLTGETRQGFTSEQETRQGFTSEQETRRGFTSEQEARQGVTPEQETRERGLHTVAEAMGRTGGQTLLRMDDGRTDARDYAYDMLLTYNAGKTGREMPQAASLNEPQRQAAYLAGQADAQSEAKAALDVARPAEAGVQAEPSTLPAAQNASERIQTDSDAAAQNHNAEVLDDDRTAEEPAIRVRDGGERPAGENPGGELPGVEGAAEPDQGDGRLLSDRPADQSEAGKADAWLGRAADKGAAGLTYLQETVSTKDLGLRGGLESDSIHIVADGMTEATQEAFDTAHERGLELMFFAGGDLHTETASDGARGYYDAQSGIIYVRVDDPDYTAAQITRHEIGHDMIAKGEVDLAAVRARCREIAPDGNVDALADLYAAAYAGSGLTPEEAWEECVCDSLAGMNVFGQVFESAKAEYAETMEQIRSAAVETESARGPPATENAATAGGKASIVTTADGKKTGTSYTGRSLTGDSEVYSYDFMTAQKDMEVVSMPALSEVKSGDKVDRVKAVDMGIKNAAENGRMVSETVSTVTNQYTGRDILISKSSLEHSLDGAVSRIRTNARLAAIAGDIVKNAIPINALKSKRQAQGTYAMAALAQSGDRHVVAIVTVEQHSSEVNQIDFIDVAHAINGRLEAKENGSRTSTRELDLDNPFTAAKISIAGLLEIVKGTHQSILSDNVLKHFGEERNQGGYYADKSEFSRRLKSMEELRAENEDLRARVEYWKGQTKRTSEPSVRSEDVKKLTSDLLKGYHSKADAETVGKAITDAGNYLVRSGEKGAVRYEELKSRVLPAARELVQNAETLVNAEDMQDYAAIKKLLRQKVRITAAEAEHIADFKDWKKRYQNRLHVAVGGDATPMDVRYAELSDAWPSLFPADILAPVDQLLRLGEVLDSLRPIYENPYSYDMATATEYCANEIVDALLADRVRQTAPTFADQQAAKQADALLAGQMNQGAKMAEAMRKAEERHQRSRERAAEALNRVRTQRDEQIAALKEHYAEVRKGQAERRADAKARDRLLKIARRLKNKKLPAANRALLDQYIGELDTVSKSLTEKSVSKLTELREWYEDQKANNPDFIPDARTEERLKRLSRKQIKDLSAQEVAELTEVLLHIETELQNQRKLIDSEDRRDTYAQGVQVIEDMENSLGTKAGSLTRKADELIVNGTLSPVRAVRRMIGYADDDPLYRLTQALADGQRTMLDYQRRAGALFTKWTEDRALTERIKGKNAEGIEIQGTEQGRPVTVTISPAMRMSLYLHSLNAQNMKHISGYSTKADEKTYRLTGELTVGGNRGGGLTVPDWDLYRKGKIAEAYNNSRTILLTPRQIQAAIVGMSAEEKAFADAAHDYFNRMSREELNAVSEKLLGYSLAEVEDYFPIETDRNFIQKDFDSVKFDGTIEGMGFTKERVDSAKPVMLYDMDDVLRRSIDNHAKYVGLAIPVRNFCKVWGISTLSYDAEGNRNGYESSVMQAVRKKWGGAGFDYVEKMIADLQGGGKRDKGLSAVLAKARSHYAGAVLTLNAGVAVKQAASYPTAGAVLGGKALAKALADTGKVDRARIDRYTPLLWYRSQGFGTKELGDMAKQGPQLPKVLNWIQAMDVRTTSKLWKASEYYVRDGRKDLTVGSEDYYRAVAEVYNRVIEETQPNYTVMQRPQLLRAEDSLTQSLMMFKTQPFQNFNILYDAIGNLRAKRAAFVNASEVSKPEAKAALQKAQRDAVRAVVSQALAAVVFAGMTAAWKGLRGKDDDYRDEDGEGGLLSLAFWKRLGLDTVGSLAGMLPFGSDLWEAAESRLSGRTYSGFDEITASAINDYVKAIGTACKALGEIWTGVKSGEGIDWNELRLKLIDVAKTAGRALNIPSENVVNLLAAAAWQVLRATQGTYKGRYAYLRLTASPDGKSQQYYDNLYRAMQNDRTAYEDIYRAMVESGDFTEEKIRGAMENRMKKAQGVTKAAELENRYLPPEAAKEYNRVKDVIAGSRIWEVAGNREGLQEKTLQRLYDLTMGTGDGKALREKIDGGAVYGLDESKYLLYRTALDTVDKPTESGKYGSYTNAEVEAAVKAVPGLTKEEREYLWIAQGKSEKNMPKW